MYLKWLLGCLFFYHHCCDSDSIYMHTAKCADSTWNRAEAYSFGIPIQDSDQAYDVYILLTYTDDIYYQNLYISHQVKTDNGNILATTLSNHMLFDAKTGKPLGRGFMKKKSIRLPLIYDYKFPHSGNYSITLTQFMRVEELQGIVSVGLQVCKSKRNSK